MRDAATAVTDLRRRIVAVLLWRHLLGSAAIACVLWGVATLLVRRAGLGLPRPLGAILVVAAFLIAAELQSIERAGTGAQAHPAQT